MPAAYSHEIITKSALEVLELPQWWNPAMEDCALIGAQGPDPLFFYSIMPPRLNTRVHRLGSAMHDQRVGEMLRAILEAANWHEHSARAWAIGFLSHYAVDTVIHPFVYGNSFEKGKYLTRIHLSMEKAMDTWLYRQGGKQGIPRHFEGIRRTLAQHKQAIAQVWGQAVAQVFPEYRVGQQQIRKALDSAVRVASLLHSPKGKKFKLFSAIGRLLGNHQLITAHMVPMQLSNMDFLNQTQQVWYSPWERERERKESLIQLMQQAQERACGFMADGLDYFAGRLPLDELMGRLGAMNYSSGLDWKRTIELDIPHLDG